MENIIEETIENDEQLFTICVDDNGYYTTESTDNLVQVKEMPKDITDVKQLFAYKYNSETQSLEADETKLAEINYEIDNPPVTLTSEERLADLENAFLELSMMMLGGE